MPGPREDCGIGAHLTTLRKLGAGHGMARTPPISRGAQKGLLDGLGKAVDDSEVGADSAGGLGSAKLPILQGASTETETVGELRLRQAGFRANCSDIYRTGNVVLVGAERDLAADVRGGFL